LVGCLFFWYSLLIIAVGYSLSHPRSESGKSVTEMLDEWERKKEHERMLEAWEPGYHKHQQEYQELAEAAEKASQQGDRAEAERLKAQLNEMQNKRFYLRR
jgi:predicted secreted protein